MYMYVYVCMCFYVHACVYIHIHIYIYVYMCMCVYIYIHTYTCQYQAPSRLQEASGDPKKSWSPGKPTWCRTCRMERPERLNLRQKHRAVVKSWIAGSRCPSLQLLRHMCAANGLSPSFEKNATWALCAYRPSTGPSLSLGRKLRYSQLAFCRTAEMQNALLRHWLAKPQVLPAPELALGLRSVAF